MQLLKGRKMIYINNISTNIPSSLYQFFSGKNVRTGNFLI